MEDHYLAKWLAGELRGEELEKFEASEDFATYMKIKAATEGLETESDFRKEEVWNRIKESRSETQSEAGTKSRNAAPSSEEEPPVRPLHARRSFLRVAASIAILLGVSYFLLLPRDTRVSAGAAQRELAILPDDSKVTLNAGTEISFREKNWNENRMVRLQGQAFFDVEKGQRFSVETSMGIVTVLGTEFDVVQRDQLFRVDCFEGRVSVRYQGNDYELTPGRSLQVLAGEGVWEFEHSRSVPAWIEKESTFRSVPLEIVLRELEQQYNVRVVTENVAANKRFTGTFRHDNLRQALEYITAPTKLTYVIEKGQVRLYGATNQRK